jgi:1-acyl-sn-glycerol-3-phosphate acyltransferase
VIHKIADKLFSHPSKTVSFTGYKFSWFDWFCLFYPPGWLIIFNRHWQHYHHNPEGWNWLEYGLFLLPGGFYLALLMRWLRLGCRPPSTEFSEFDANYQQAFREEVLAPIVKYHFRGELQQLENLPQTGPMIVAMNHAGMCFPWDFVTLAYLLSQGRDWVVQPLAGISLFEHAWMTWWLPPGWSQVVGGIRAQLSDFEAAMQAGKIVLYAPEGLRGPLKGWKRRYQLEKFDVSFVQLSDRYQVPILPVVCIGNESLHPWTVNLKRWQRFFKLPFLPLSPLMLVLVLFPSMGVWAMKTHLRYYIEPPEQISLPHNSVKKLTVAYREAQKLKEKLQIKINQLLGRQAY